MMMVFRWAVVVNHQNHVDFAWILTSKQSKRACINASFFRTAKIKTSQTAFKGASETQPAIFSLKTSVYCNAFEK